MPPIFDLLVVINKPAGMLSVPGKDNQVSIYYLMKERYHDAVGLSIVHRLDMDSSGPMIVAILCSAWICAIEKE